MNTFIQHGHIKLIKSDSNFFIYSNLYYLFINKILPLFSIDELNGSKVTVKTFIILQKISISNKCCSIKLHSSVNPEKQTYSVFNIDNNQKSVSVFCF